MGRYAKGDGLEGLSAVQREAVLQLYRLLEQWGSPLYRTAIDEAWQRLDQSTDQPIQRLIVREIYTALANLQKRQICDLQAILGSWGDTMSDKDVLGFLQSLNTRGEIIVPFADSGGGRKTG